jgi:hypothetical protein
MASLIEKLTGKKSENRTWVPSNPDAAFRVEPLSNVEDFADSELKSSPWHLASPKSHLEKFRLFSTKTDRIARRFIGKSYLEVIFREKVTTSTGKYYPATVYAFYFDSPEEAEECYQAMKATVSPGTVLWAKAIRPGVPYERKA